MSDEGKMNPDASTEDVYHKVEEELSDDDDEPHQPQHHPKPSHGYQSQDLVGEDNLAMLIQVKEDHSILVSGTLDQLEDGQFIALASASHADGQRQIILADSSSKAALNLEPVALDMSDVTSTHLMTENGGTVELVTMTLDHNAVNLAESVELITEDKLSSYLIQSSDDYKSTLLLRILIDSKVTKRTGDLAIFCSDGVAFSHAFLLAAVSPTLRKALEETGDMSCLIVPDLMKQDMEYFVDALFASESDMSLNPYRLIHVAETLGVELPFTTNEPKTDSSLNVIDYKTALSKSEDRGRVFQCLGYEPMDGFMIGSAAKEGFRSTHSAVIGLSGVLNQSPHVCSQCMRRFADQATLNRHVTLLHGVERSSGRKIGKEYTCRHCSKKFEYGLNLKLHISMCHPHTTTDGKEKQATNLLMCQESAKKLKLLEKYNEMSCKVCGFKARGWKQLQMHIMNHTNERPYRCETCGKDFKELQKLRRHHLVHSGERNFRCQYCHKAFNLKHNMIVHERIHQSKCHACGYCGKVFSQAADLKQHTTLHAKKAHIITRDPATRAAQKFSSRAGRPPLGRHFIQGEREQVQIASSASPTVND